ncbi:MAG: TolC family protein [Myxococcota bacterium]
MKNRVSGIRVAVCAALSGCAHADLSSERDALRAWQPSPVIQTGAAFEREAAEGPWMGVELQRLDGALPRFVAYALKESPDLQAAHARWRAAVEGAAGAGRLPNPEVGYGGFVRSVETRVGPQLHRISLKQAFPWPGRLGAATDAMASAAASAGDAFRAQVLVLVRNVASAYWELWQVERSHRIRLDHERILTGLVETIQARVETGEKSIAELLQVQLRLQSLRDHRTRHQSLTRRHQARLLAAIGADPGLKIATTTTEPAVKLPAENLASLREHVRRNPEVTRWTDLEAARVSEARAARTKRLPDFRVGADYIVTGEAPIEGVAESGKDPIILSFGLTVPLWLGRYQSEIRQAESEATAARASRRGAWLRVAAELEATVARLFETHERIVRYEGTLIPQAEALQGSVNAAYEVGRAGVSEVLLALEEELELRLELAEARATHARAWAELERLTGRSLDGIEPGASS